MSTALLAFVFAWRALVAPPFRKFEQRPSLNTVMKMSAAMQTMSTQQTHPYNLPESAVGTLSAGLNSQLLRPQKSILSCAQRKKIRITNNMVAKLSIERWGPAGWNFIHAASFSYPEHPTEEQRMHMYAFLQALGHVLPCKLCCKHFSRMTERDCPDHHSSVLSSRKSLAVWLVGAHNEVNERLGKPKLSFEAVFQQYMHGPAKVRAQYASVACVVMIILACAVFLLVRKRATPRKRDIARMLTSFYQE